MVEDTAWTTPASKDTDWKMPGDTDWKSPQQLAPAITPIISQARSEAALASPAGQTLTQSTAGKAAQNLQNIQEDKFRKSLGNELYEPSILGDLPPFKQIHDYLTPQINLASALTAGYGNVLQKEANTKATGPLRDVWSRVGGGIQSAGKLAYNREQLGDVLPEEAGKLPIVGHKLEQMLSNPISRGLIDFSGGLLNEQNLPLIITGEVGLKMTGTVAKKLISGGLTLGTGAVMATQIPGMVEAMSDAYGRGDYKMMMRLAATDVGNAALMSMMALHGYNQIMDAVRPTLPLTKGEVAKFGEKLNRVFPAPDEYTPPIPSPPTAPITPAGGAGPMPDNVTPTYNRMAMDYFDHINSKYGLTPNESDVLGLAINKKLFEKEGILLEDSEEALKNALEPKDLPQKLQNAFSEIWPEVVADSRRQTMQKVPSPDGPAGLSGETVKGVNGEPVQRNNPPAPELQKAIQTRFGELAGAWNPAKAKDSLLSMLEFMKDHYDIREPIRLFLGGKDTEVSRTVPNKNGGFDIHLAEDSIDPHSLVHEVFHVLRDTGKLEESFPDDNNAIAKKFIQDTAQGTDYSSRIFPGIDTVMQLGKDVGGTLYDATKGLYNFLTSGLPKDYKFGGFAPLRGATEAVRSNLAAFVGERNRFRAAVAMSQTADKIRNYFIDREAKQSESKLENMADLQDPSLSDEMKDKIRSEAKLPLWIKEIDQVREGKIDEIKDPIAKEFHKMWRDISDRQWQEINKYKNLSYLQNYEKFPWKVAPKHVEELNTNYLGKIPLEGSKDMFRKRIYEYVRDGMKDGGVPAFDNPMDVFFSQWMDDAKFTLFNKLFRASKDSGTAMYRPLSGNESIPVDYKTIQDRVGTVWSRGEKGELIKRGEWMFDPTLADALDNFTSHDLLRGNKMGASFLEAKNLITQLELGWSGFHWMFITNQAMASRIGHAIGAFWNQGAASLIQDAIKGEVPKVTGEAFKQGGKDLLGAATAPTQAMFTTGKDILQYVKNEGELDNALKLQKLNEFAKKNGFDSVQQVKRLWFAGGGDVGLSYDYRLKFMQSFRDSMQNGSQIGELVKAYPALTQLVTKPLFETYIPQMKMLMFMYEYGKRRQFYDTTSGVGSRTDEYVAREAKEASENVFGEMSMDRFFWDNTTRSAMQFLFRALTWRIGSISQYSNAVKSQAIELARTFSENPGPGGRVPRLTPDMQWLLGNIIVHFGESYILQKALTATNPQNLEDYIFPQIGGMDKTGHPLRLKPATYTPDLWFALHDPMAYGKAGLSSILRPISSTVSGQNYWGEHVGIDQPESILREAVPLPFSVQSYQRLREAGASPGASSLSAVGFAKAPGYVGKSDTEKKLEGILTSHGGMSQEVDDAMRGRAVSAAKGQIRYGENPDAAKQAIRGMDISPRQKQSALAGASKYDYYQEIVKKAPWRQAMDILMGPDVKPDEFFNLAPVLMSRRESVLKSVEGTSRFKDTNAKFQILEAKLNEMKKKYGNM